MLWNHIWPAGWAVVLLPLLLGCTTPSPDLHAHLQKLNIPSRLELDDTPFFPQEKYQCGPAALATVLRKSGVQVTPAQLEEKIYLPQRQGSLQLELVAATRRYQRLPYLLDGELEAILNELNSGRPVLVLQNLGLAMYPIWHYAVVIGFDGDSNEIILRSGDRRRFIMTPRRFMRSWELAAYWSLVVLRPEELPLDASEARYVDAAVAMEMVSPPDVASRYYSTALSRWPDNSMALFGAGNARYNTGENDTAEIAYRHLLAIEPEHLAARNNLAFLLLQRGCTTEALREIEVALASAAKGDPMRTTLTDTKYEILDKSKFQKDIDTGCAEKKSR